MRVGAVLAMTLWAGAAVAGDWVPLSGEALQAALVARSLGYPDGAMQGFAADGTTQHEVGGRSSAGRWRIEGDRYCSSWPPGESWACYAVARSADGLDLRFTDERGGATTGRYIDLR
jgi:hypothetical protein